MLLKDDGRNLFNGQKYSVRFSQQDLAASDALTSQYVAGVR